MQSLVPQVQVRNVLKRQEQAKIMPQGLFADISFDGNVLDSGSAQPFICNKGKNPSNQSVPFMRNSVCGRG